MEPPELIDKGRRSLLQAGLLGSFALVTAGVAATLSGCGGHGAPAASGYHFLREADLPLLKAVIPVVLGSLLPAARAERERMMYDLLQRIDLSGHRLGRPAQKSATQLFDLLNLRASRWALTGVGSWEQATPQQMHVFLERWRLSSFALLNAGYKVLVKLVAGSFYGTPAGWAAANYPGPPPGPYQVFNS